MTPAASSPRSSTWTPLLYTWFRWLWIASVVSNIGTWMQNVGAAWLMTELAPSALLVALVQTATNLPVFLLGVPAGAAGDLFNRRKLLLVTQGLMLAAAAVLGVMTLTGSTGPWTLLWLTFALGLGATMNGPTWQAIMPDLVPNSELPAAIALNSVGFNLARAVGPALGGAVVAAIGAGAAFILNAVSFVGVMIVLYLWRRDTEQQPRRISTERVGAAMLAGMRYVRFAPSIHSVLLRSGSFIISASALWSLLPLVAKVELHRDSTGYGLLLGCLGVGSILGALMLHRLRQTFLAGHHGHRRSGALRRGERIAGVSGKFWRGSSRAGGHRRCMDDRQLDAHHRNANLRARLGARPRVGRLSTGVPRFHGGGECDLGRGGHANRDSAPRSYAPALRCSLPLPQRSGYGWPDLRELDTSAVRTLAGTNPGGRAPRRARTGASNSGIPYRSRHRTRVRARHAAHAQHPPPRRSHSLGTL